MEHIVQPGETMASIASLYGVNVGDIMFANGLQTDLVNPGQSLFIPQPQPTPTPTPYQHYHTHTHTHTHFHRQP
jgi:LysM repeat protein